jgi:hypothetical protein
MPARTTGVSTSSTVLAKALAHRCASAGSSPTRAALRAGTSTAASAPPAKTSNSRFETRLVLVYVLPR